MNEQAVQKVISEYAIENANLRLAVATIKAELEATKLALEEKETNDKK